jgi:hypothetical protein
MKLGVGGAPGQQLPAAGERFGRAPRVAQHRDRRLRCLEVRRIEREAAVESGQRRFEIAQSVTAGAEEKPRPGIARIAGAGGFEKRLCFA